ncbi:MAG: hydantoinase/oxoprolinase family protein [Alphaproteobacteria bacterium]|nr:hydantoinase/oxoprolinase family protein [Alphaproteobacteria bacterium]
MSYRIGVDIGGTFTDFCVFNEKTNELTPLKVLSTPATPGAEVFEGMRQLGERHGIEPSRVTGFTHGTTVGINTVIQRKGARMALFTTEGFGDVLELARLRMPDTTSLFCARPEPLITKERVFPIAERMLADGTPERSVDEASVKAAIAGARAKGCVGIIVSLINGYRNPAHEQQVKAIVERIAPDLFVFCSTDVWPVIREYERTTTTIINGYIHPRVAGYLTSLQRALKERGVRAEPLITKSNGGVMSAELGKRACVGMVMSGTASGVMGASYVARACGVSDAITLDIGGTSADVALIDKGKPQFGMGEKIGDFPLYMPTVSVTSIGDGGGSIAWVDDFGVLKVGPESAGSDPGPACYGRGGTRPTITDAFAVCGFLGHAPLGYNAVTVDPAKARTAIETIAGKLKRTVEDTAEAIIKVAISGMFVEINKLGARYGIDTRDYALMTFGGAGPMMGCFLARELNMKRVLVPMAPGVVCALGGLIADMKNDFIKTVYLDAAPAAAKAIKATYAELEKKAVAWLRSEQGFKGKYTLTYSADMNYQGQSFEIEVFLDAKKAKAGDVRHILSAFHKAHEAIYAFSDDNAGARIVNLRLVIAGALPKPKFARLRKSTRPPKPAKQIEVRFDGKRHKVPLYHRADLLAGQKLKGPAVIAQDDATTCVPPGFAGTVAAHGDIILSKRG